MKTKYKAAFWADRTRLELLSDLREFEIFLVAGEFEAVEFYEDDKHFFALKQIFTKYDIALDSCSIYTENERLASKFLGVEPSWHYGYPQPENDYEELCYDLSHYCHQCGIGAKQIQSLRFKGEPRWGRRQILQLNWVFDEYFVTPAIYKEFFEPAGIGFLEVVDHKRNTILQSVLQLVLPTVESNLLMDGYSFEICRKCGEKKYLPIKMGGYPLLNGDTSFPIFKSREFFGSGASARKAVFVNNSLYVALIKSRIKGVSFVPVFEK